MKNTLKISSLFLLLVAMLSCNNDEDTTPVVATTQGPVLNSPATGTSIVLSTDAQFADSPALTLVWNDAAYNLLSPSAYTIEMALAGTNFEAPCLGLERHCNSTK